MECWRGTDDGKHLDDSVCVYCAYSRKRDPIIALFVIFDKLDDDQLELTFTESSLTVITAWMLGKRFFRDSASESDVASRVSGLSMTELRTSEINSADSEQPVLCRVRLLGDGGEAVQLLVQRKAAAPAPPAAASEVEQLKKVMSKCFDKMTSAMKDCNAETCVPGSPHPLLVIISCDVRPILLNY